MTYTSKTFLCFFAICALAANAFRPIASNKISMRPTLATLYSSSDSNNAASKNSFHKKLDKAFKASMLAFFAAVQLASARPEGVNRPDLLPKELNVPLIDVANFLSKGQEKKITASIVELQKVTGWKLRILCQR